MTTTPGSLARARPRSRYPTRVPNEVPRQDYDVPALGSISSAELIFAIVYSAATAGFVAARAGPLPGGVALLTAANRPPLPYERFPRRFSVTPDDVLLASARAVGGHVRCAMRY